MHTQSFQKFHLILQLLPHLEMFMVYYKPGNVKLTPKILDSYQKYINEKDGTSGLPVNFVFSRRFRIIIRRNKRSHRLWCNQNEHRYGYTMGSLGCVRQYELKNRDYLQSQIGNPDGEDKLIKNITIHVKWLRELETSKVERLKQAFEDLNCIDRN
jgi:fructose-bisphosphate aldolase class II